MEGTDRDPLLITSEPNESIPSETSVTTTRDVSSDSYKWKVLKSCLNCVVHSMIGANVYVTLWFAFKSTPITPFQIHVALCMIGYQLLMSHAILSLNACNSWSASLSLRDRRRVHWILQVTGAVAAIAGSVVMMLQKSVNFNTVHGKLALAALVLTSISLINGGISLYAVELRRLIPTKVSKISHIILGTAAFVLSSVCLAFGYNKKSFKEWASEEFSMVMIGVTSIYTAAVVLAPCYSFWRKLFAMCKIKIF